MTVRQYQDLIVWQKAMDLVARVYEVSETFPRREMFGLTNQLRRAAVSVPSNIAEGQGRHSTRDFLRHLSIARGSLQEVETQILIAATEIPGGNFDRRASRKDRGGESIDVRALKVSFPKSVLRV